MSVNVIVIKEIMAVVSFQMIPLWQQWALFELKDKFRFATVTFQGLRPAASVCVIFVGFFIAKLL